MSDSVRPHRRQPTRLPHPWDSPGKITGVGCHFLHQCMKVKSESEVTQSCLTLSDLMDHSLPGSSAHGIFQAIFLEWCAIAFSVMPLYYTFKHGEHVTFFALCILSQFLKSKCNDPMFILLDIKNKFLLHTLYVVSVSPCIKVFYLRIQIIWTSKNHSPSLHLYGCFRF